MSNPRSNGSGYSHPDDDYSRGDTARDDYDNDEDDIREDRRLNRDTQLPTLRATGMLHQDMIKRRTAGALTGLNILPDDVEQENLHSIAQIRGDGNFRDSNFSTLKHAPKSRRIFKELLITGKFKEINKEVEPMEDGQEVYAVDEEDILEYQLFQSIDSWSRRIAKFLNLCSGVIVGMFVVFAIIVASVGKSEEYALYFCQMYTLFINLAVIFSVAEALINYETYSRLSKHNDADQYKFQGYFIVSMIWLVLFMICWILIVLLPFAVIPMVYDDAVSITSNQRSYFEYSNIFVGSVFTIFFITASFISRDDYFFDSYEKLYSDDDLHAPEPDAIEMTAYV
jgi:hypothetical protein